MKLSDEQIRAVNESRNILLTACPGSGKTRTLTFKIAHELEKIIGTKKIVVALTYTNRASDEIKERISRMNIEPKSQLWTGTIHAFCLEWILRPYRGFLNELKNGFVIADEYRSAEILDELKEKYEVAGYTTIITRINSDGSLVEIENIKLVKEYHQILRDQKLVDFDQILYYSNLLLQTYPQINRILNNLFHIICVDEYQDTQELQYEILSKIVKVKNGSTRVFMVGDSDQAIYGSLGGVAKTLREISSQFGNIPIVELQLSGNYRSNQRIIDYYSAFQSSKIDIKALGTNAGDRGWISFSNQEIDRENIDKTIAEIIAAKIAEGIPENEICVLAPQWWHVIPMGRKLKSLLPKLNFDAPGLSPLSKNKENIWYKGARLFLLDPSPATYKIRKRWANEFLSELDGAGQFLFLNSEHRAKDLLKVINSIRSEENDGLRYLEDVLSKLMTCVDVKIEDNVQLNLHWNTFFDGVKKRINTGQFEYASDLQSFKSVFAHRQGIVVNTCHGVKGEEFEIVIAFGLLHGYLPNWKENDPAASAKKLLYVICSRAKTGLYLFAESGHKTRKGAPYSTTDLLANLKYDYN